MIGDILDLSKIESGTLKFVWSDVNINAMMYDLEELFQLRNKNNPEAQAYMDKASRCISHPLKHLQEEIDTTNVVTLTNIVQRKSALIRESRKIVDREEANEIGRAHV